MVLTNVRFVEAKLVEPLEQLKVALQGQRGVFAHPVEGRQEHPELHPSGYRHLAILLRVHLNVLRGSRGGRKIKIMFSGALRMLLPGSVGCSVWRPVASGIATLATGVADSGPGPGINRPGTTRT
jgi:hypothetical protein